MDGNAEELLPGIDEIESATMEAFVESRLQGCIRSSKPLRVRPRPIDGFSSVSIDGKSSLCQLARRRWAA